MVALSLLSLSQLKCILNIYVIGSPATTLHFPSNLRLSWSPSLLLRSAPEMPTVVMIQFLRISLLLGCGSQDGCRC